MTLLVGIVFSIGIICKHATVSGIHAAIHGDIPTTPLSSVRKPAVVSRRAARWQTIVGI